MGTSSLISLDDRTFGVLRLFLDIPYQDGWCIFKDGVYGVKEPNDITERTHQFFHHLNHEQPVPYETLLNRPVKKLNLLERTGCILVGFFLITMPFINVILDLALRTLVISRKREYNALRHHVRDLDFQSEKSGVSRLKKKNSLSGLNALKMGAAPKEQDFESAVRSFEEGKFDGKYPKINFKLRKTDSLEADFACTKGRQKEMLDRSSAEMFTFELHGKEKIGEMTSLFDGFNGVEAVNIAREYLPIILRHQLTAYGSDIKMDKTTIVRMALKQTALALDNLCRPYASGTTAAIVLKIDQDIYAANIGSSRSFLREPKLTSIVTIALNSKMTPEESKSRKSVEKRGGEVNYWEGYQVNMAGKNEGVTTTRAIGGWNMVYKNEESGDKSKILSPTPKITHFALKEVPNGSEIFIGTHGLFSVVGEHAEVIAALSRLKKAWKDKYKTHATNQNVLETLLKSSYDAGAGEDVSAMIVKLPK